jgi:magnesium transporter
MASDPIPAALTAEFLRAYPGEVAHLIEAWPRADIVELFRQDPVDVNALALVVEHLTVDTAAHLLEDLEPSSGAALLARIDPGRAAALLGPLSVTGRDGILSRLPTAIAAEIRDLMTYPADCAGSLMDVQITTVRVDATAGQALERMRSSHARGIDIVAVDPDGVLVGTLPIDEVALAPPERAVRDLIHRTPVSVQALAPREDVVDQLSRMKLASLPVVDAEQRVVGIIRHSALVRAAEEEVSADIQTMVGASAAERALSPVRFAVSKRLPWLEINLVTAFLAAAVVGIFEDTIARFTALAILLPVVAGQSGNTGAQALAVTMRALVLREIRLRHWSRVLSKEARVALVNGIGVASTTAVAVYIWSRSMGLSTIIALSMVISMVCAGLAGAAVPMCLVAARQDPAQSSSIILTTVTDVVGFLSFLGIATLLAGSL